MIINKHDDLCMMISGQEPDTILLTEIIPKAQVLPISSALLEIPGTRYTVTLIQENQTLKGVAYVVYVSV